MLLGEREGRPAGAAGVGPRGLLWPAHRDVDVDDRPAEQLVAQCAADDPCLLAGQDLLRQLRHSTTVRRARVGSLDTPHTIS